MQLKTMLAGLAVATALQAAACEIMTSPLDHGKMRLGYSNWQVQTVPIVATGSMTYTSFVDAYKNVDEEAREYIEKTVCKKQHWNGVANYKIAWQQTENTYNFVVTFDAFAYR